MKDSISWVHFGDLHVQRASDENYLDFLELIEEANSYLAEEVDFAFLPGDNADDGTAEEYELVRCALDRLCLPVHIITGDHDRKAGSLQAFVHHLEPALFRSYDLLRFRLLFLNAMDGADATTFDLSSSQLAWLEAQLQDAQIRKLRPLVFHHLYPSELATQAQRFTNLIHQFGVELVEMGHTHYNELANDGCTIYAATRSTGQIEEGPPGFSITCIDDDVISWKFKQRRAWPFVLITSPADEKLITAPASVNHVLRGPVAIRAKVYAHPFASPVLCSIDGAAEVLMQATGDSWEYIWNTGTIEDGIHRIVVSTANASDEINAYVNQQGNYSAPRRRAVDYENVIGAYETKGILGTQLGPNENGTKGPWPSWR